MPDQFNPGKNIEKDKISLRQFEEQDEQDVYNLHVEGLKSAGIFTEDPEARIILDRDLRRIREEYINNRGDFLVITINGKIVGMGAIRKVDEVTGEIKRMRVKPELQGQGIGKTILDKLISRAKELGYKKLILDVAEKQKVARGLYESRGFKEYKRGEYYGDKTVYYDLEM